MYENAIELKEIHPMYEKTVERAKKLFLDGYRIVIGLSGKDSCAAAVCVVQGLLEAVKIAPKNVAGLHILTTNTTLDNMVIMSYIKDLHQDLNEYGKNMELPIFTKILKPALSMNPIVELAGRGKLLGTPKTSVNSKSCADDWKIKPVKKELANMRKLYQTTKIINISGSRSSESKARSKSLSLRNESPTEIVKTDLGFSLSIIMDWTLNDVWSLFKAIDFGDIESFSDRFDLLTKHYSAGNNGVCDLFAGDINKNTKSCGSRFGCVTCGFAGESDKSLEAQIAIDPKTYGFMEPLNKLRSFLLNTLFDYKHRTMIGHKIDDGFIKVGVNSYSMSYRMALLRYILTIQAEAFEAHGYHKIQLVDYDVLIAIQYHWSKSGYEQEPGMAFKIWHEVVNHGVSYPIPDSTMHEQIAIPKYKFFPLEEYIDRADVTGLDDESLDNRFSSIARVYFKDGETKRVVRYEENKTFSVVTKDGLAMDFVEDFYITLVENAHLENKDPTVMLKHLLESGVLQLSKGTIARLNSDVIRAQTLNRIQHASGVPFENYIVACSVSKQIKDLMVSERLNKAEPLMQASLF